MTTKQKVIDESIKRAIQRLDEINSIIDADPLREIIELRKEAQEKLDQARENGNELEPEFMAYIKKAAKKEKQLFKLAQKRKNHADLLEEKTPLELELSDLKNEKYLLQCKI